MADEATIYPTAVSQERGYGCSSWYQSFNIKAIKVSQIIPGNYYLPSSLFLIKCRSLLFIGLYFL